jgi:hypothetical protein
VTRKWTNADRQRFADRNILKALRIPSRRKPPPDADEWGSTWLDAPGALEDERAAEQRLVQKSDTLRNVDMNPNEHKE